MKIQTVTSRSILLGALFLAACSPHLLETLEEGIWGGDHIALDVTAAVSRFEMDCAHAFLPAPIQTDRNGRFELRGTFVLEHGGPYREGEPEDARPAVFFGSVDGDEMQLTIDVVDQSIPPLVFELRKGEAGLLHKCL